jgi:mannose-6-phosphate isomerase-like protein (cupin superfamily)
MLVKNLRKCRLFIAGDDSRLREILSPRKTRLNLGYSLAWAKVRPGRSTLPHTLRYSEVYYILRGRGMVHVDRRRRSVKTGDTVYIPPRAVQWIRNSSTIALEFLCIVDPAWEPRCERLTGPVGKQVRRSNQRSRVRRNP